MADPPDRTPTSTRLPAPLAPVARDANPWPMPARQGDLTRSRVVPPRFRRPAEPPTASPSSSPRPAAGTAPGTNAGQAAPGSRPGISRFVPFAIFLAVLGSIASSAMEALNRGDLVAILIPLFVVVFMAVGWWRAMRRRRDR